MPTRFAAKKWIFVVQAVACGTFGAFSVIMGPLYFLVLYSVRTVGPVGCRDSLNGDRHCDASRTRLLFLWNYQSNFNLSARSNRATERGPQQDESRRGQVVT
jgi:hypothetical protein